MRERLYFGDERDGEPGGEPDPEEARLAALPRVAHRGAGRKELLREAREVDARTRELERMADERASQRFSGRLLCLCWVVWWLCFFLLMAYGNYLLHLMDRRG